MHRHIHIPQRLANFCGTDPKRSAWLEELPNVVEDLAVRWSLEVDDPFDHDDATCSWVAPVRSASGAELVLKLGVPHTEAQHEIDALRSLHGDPTVYLVEEDATINAMLLERCQPGTSLREASIAEQDAVISDLIKRFWLGPATPPFRHLSEMIELWSEETRQTSDKWPDKELVGEGLAVLHDLARPSSSDVLLATDLHAGNVLRAQRKPWLVIDPKPFIGDPAYDGTQHLLNNRRRIYEDPDGTIRGFAELLGVDERRLRLWMFARLAAEPRDSWDDQPLALARRIGTSRLL